METPPQFHDITAILSPYPQFSVFSHYLNVTGVATAINGRTGKTVCVVDNSAMEDLLSHNPSLSTLQNIISFHIFHDCYKASALPRCQEAIPCFGGGDSGIIIVRSPYERVKFDHSADGKIRFTVPFAGGGISEFQKQIKFVKKTYLSVIQISNLLPTLDLLSHSPPSAAIEGEDLIRTIYSHGARSFAAAISSFKPAVEALRSSLRSGKGLTIFCPVDENFWCSEYIRTDLGMHTDEDQISVLLYHAVPSYNSIEMLRSARTIETLATLKGGRMVSFGVKIVNGEKDVVVEPPTWFDEEGVEYRETRILRMLVDKEPLALYAIEGVLTSVLH